MEPTFDGPVKPNEGLTSRELDRRLADLPEDPSIAEEVEYVKRQVLDWENGGSSEDTLRALFKRYYSTDAQVSDQASVLLMQSTFWFSAEAGIPPEDQIRILTDEEFHAQQIRRLKDEAIRQLIFGNKE